VLLVEDQYILSLAARRCLEARGATVVGPFTECAAAGEALQVHRVDAALLDLYVDDGSTVDLALILLSERIPVALVTGGSQAESPEELAQLKDARCFFKPARYEEVADYLADRLGESTPPL
jgi:DNA-binding NtrC family response regulator